MSQPDFKTDIAKSNALTYEMIYQQPVCYEFSDFSMPVLLVVGGEGRTIVGKALLGDADKKGMASIRSWAGRRLHRSGMDSLKCYQV